MRREWALLIVVSVIASADVQTLTNALIADVGALELLQLKGILQSDLASPQGHAHDPDIAPDAEKAVTASEAADEAGAHEPDNYEAMFGGSHDLREDNTVGTVGAEIIPEKFFRNPDSGDMTRAEVRRRDFDSDVFVGSNSSDDDNDDDDAILDLGAYAQKTWLFFVDGFKQIALNNKHSDLCGVSKQGSLLCRAARFGWYALPVFPGKPKFVAMNNEFVIVVNTKGHVFRWQLRPQSAYWIPVGSKDADGKVVMFKQVATNDKHVVCGISTERELYCKHGYISPWQKAPILSGEPSFVALNARDVFVATDDPYEHERTLFVKPANASSLQGEDGWFQPNITGASLSEITVNDQPSLDQHLLCGKSTGDNFRCTRNFVQNGTSKWYDIGGTYKPKYIVANDKYVLVVTSLGHVFIKAA